MFSQPHKPQGFTLIELLLVLAIAGIMAAIAYPTMSDWLAYRRVATKSEQLINMLRLARAESVRLNLPVYVCPVDIADTGKPNNYCSPLMPKAMPLLPIVTAIRNSTITICLSARLF